MADDEYAELFDDGDFTEDLLLDLYKIEMGLQAAGMYFLNPCISFPDMESSDTFHGAGNPSTYSLKQCTKIADAKGPRRGIKTLQYQFVQLALTTWHTD